MTQEAYVSFETAKLLKEKGFVLNGYVRYNQNGARYHLDSIPNCELDENDDLDCPTYQRACAWLREKGYHIAVIYNLKYKSWGRIIQVLSADIEWNIVGFSSHDEAVEEGIKYALENLI